MKWLRHYAKGLVAITPGLQGEIESHLMNEELENAQRSSRFLSSLFGKDDFYLALQNHELPAERKLLTKLSKKMPRHMSVC